MNLRPDPNRLLTRLLVLLMVLSIVSPALAAYTKNITIDPGVTVYMDDVKLIPKDANGNPVEVFAYNGTTYLPARAISEALDIPIQWDGATSSVYIGKHTGNKPAVYLSDLDYFFQSGIKWDVGFEAADNLGNTHLHCFDGGGNNNISRIKYVLNGRYSRITGTLFQDNEHRNYDKGTTYKIYADGEQVWSGRVAGGIKPVDFDVNISGALELEIVCDATEFMCYGYLGDVGLWT